MPKKVLADNYIKAFNVIYGKNLSINTVEHDDEDGFVILKSEMLTPEKILVRKQLFNSLSEEAKEVIQLVLNSPSEILDLIRTPKQKRITKVKIRKHLIRSWHSTFITDLTIQELEEWVKRL